MPIRHAEGTWEGDLVKGKGTVKTESGVLNHPYSFRTRFENEKGTNPEELLKAAHAACFSMKRSRTCLPPAVMRLPAFTRRRRFLLIKSAKGFKITKIILTTDATVPGIDEKTFQETAAKAKAGCPISQALGGYPH